MVSAHSMPFPLEKNSEEKKIHELFSKEHGLSIPLEVCCETL